MSENVPGGTECAQARFERQSMHIFITGQPYVDPGCNVCIVLQNPLSLLMVLEPTGCAKWLHYARVKFFHLPLP
jgi:hypothetical protein